MPISHLAKDRRLLELRARDDIRLHDRDPLCDLPAALAKGVKPDAIRGLSASMFHSAT